MSENLTETESLARSCIHAPFAPSPELEVDLERPCCRAKWIMIKNRLDSEDFKKALENEIMRDDFCLKAFLRKERSFVKFRKRYRAEFNE